MKLPKFILSLCLAILFVDTSIAETQLSTDLIVPQAYLKADKTTGRELFGHSVALDNGTLAIGAPGAGAAYIFSKSNGAWVQQTALKPSDTGHRDQFGNSIALDGDTLVVGAPRHMGGGSTFLGSGGVYVFLRNKKGWNQQALLMAGNAQMGEMFGASVAIDGNTLIVGAPMENGDANSSEANYNTNVGSAGAAYVFTRSDGTWSQQAYLKASNAGSRDRFGTSVDLDGDTAVVGAVWERGDANSTAESPNDKLSNAGAVYVFTREGKSWRQQSYLKAGNAGHQDEFGSSISLDGETLVVGAPGEHGDLDSTSANPNRKAPNSGAAYVFTRNQGAWSQQAYLKAFNALRNHQFGISVALSGDRLVAGASEEVANADRSESKRNNKAENTGAAYVFTRDDGVWRQASYLKAAVRGKDDQFGISVTIEGNIVAVGASQEDGDHNSTATSPNDNALNAGAVYVYH